MNEEQMHELLYQALETEMGGVQVYETALRCAQNDDLKEEWEEYLEQTEHHVEILREVFDQARPRPGDGDAGPPGRPPHRRVAREGDGDGARERASRRRRARRRRVRRPRRDQGPPQLGADRQAWPRRLKGETAKALKAAYERGRGRGGRAPLPHDGLEPRAVDPVASACRPCCRRPRRRRTSRRRSARRGRSRRAAG